MIDPPFLDGATVRQIHRDQLKRYGGRDGVRDGNSLKSAIAMPHAGFGGQFFHRYPFGMAAAYAFHIAENRLFIDGNKRTALATYCHAKEGAVDANYFTDSGDGYRVEWWSFCLPIRISLLGRTAQKRIKGMCRPSHGVSNNVGRGLAESTDR